MNQESNRLPPQTKYIVGNEACERLSYYGIIAIIGAYMTDRLRYSEGQSEEIMHWWMCAVYFLPLVGGFLADRFWGRYRTILWISLAYCAGHGLLAVAEGERWSLFVALALLAIGAGGIKPCVSAFVGDQFVGPQERLLPKVYGLFYWSINFGSFFAFAFLPLIQKYYATGKNGQVPPPVDQGFGIAFAIPGIAMALATLIFWLGRKSYVIRPPASQEAEARTPAEKAESMVVLGRIMLIFAPIVVFWTLYDQQHTTWVNQAKAMEALPINLFGWTYTINAQSARLINPLLVMVLIPLLQYVVYPACEKLGWRPTPLRRMGTGMVLAGLAFCMAAVLEGKVGAAAAANEPISIAWQFPQFVVITLGEVLLSATGLEFAFSQAPKFLKSTILSLWFLGVALGNLLTAVVKGINHNYLHYSRSGELLFYGVLMLAVAGVFAMIAVRFKERPVAGTEKPVIPDPVKTT